MNFPFKRVVSYYARPTSAKHGGVNQSRQQWLLSLAERGIEILLVDARGGFTDRLVEHELISHEQLAHLGSGRMTLLPLGLGTLLRPGDLVYLHEGWTPSNIAAARICRRRGIPYVVLPHGVYEPQIIKTLKPFPGRLRLERKVLEGAFAVHLFFAEERQDLAELAPRARSVIAMTGMPVPDDAWSPPQGSPYIAWLGRYDVLHKGIDILFAALAAIPAAHRPRIEMRGPDYFGGKAETEALRHRLGLEQWVTIGDTLEREQVAPFLRSATAFVHVPRWEAFGRTILENLALGVPVMLGDGARIARTLSAARAAAVVPSTDVAALAGLLASGVPEDIGARGREWARENAAWAQASAHLVEGLTALERVTQRPR